jgi:ferric-dicitrate binding protein FerR (iron transport regulator)
MVRRAIGRVATALCVLALWLVAWGHQPLRTADLAAYAMPDGSLPELCLTDGTTGPAKAHEPCPSCTLAKAVTLPDAPQAVRVAMLARVADWRQGTAHLVATPLPRVPAARGPPVVL